MILYKSPSFDISSMANISSEARQLLNALLAKDPCQRPSAADISKCAWLQFEGMPPSQDYPDENLLKNDLIPIPLAKRLKRFSLDNAELEVELSGLSEKDLASYLPMTPTYIKRQASFDTAPKASKFSKKEK